MFRYNIEIFISQWCANCIEYQEKNKLTKLSLACFDDAGANCVCVCVYACEFMFIEYFTLPKVRDSMFSYKWQISKLDE